MFFEQMSKFNKKVLRSYTMVKKELVGNYHSTLFRHPKPGRIIRVTKLHEGKPLPTDLIQQLCHDTDEQSMIGPAGHSEDKTEKVRKTIRECGVPETLIEKIQINGHLTFARGIVLEGRPLLAIIEQHPASDRRVAHTITIVSTNHEPLRTTPVR